MAEQQTPTAEKTPQQVALMIILYLDECHRIDAVPRTGKVTDMVTMAIPTGRS